MTSDELARLRARARALFRAGDDDDEITRLWMRECARLDFLRAMAALDQYAMMDGGPNRRFIVGKFLRAYEAQPEPRRVTLVDRDAKRREAELQVARRAEADYAVREEIDMDRRIVTEADPGLVSAVISELVSWGAPAPGSSAADLPRAWRMAVADILLDRVCAAPTEAGYYEQVRDDRGAWVDDPSRPLRPLPAREWWRTYGAAALCLVSGPSARVRSP